MQMSEGARGRKTDGLQLVKKPPISRGGYHTVKAAGVKALLSKK